MLLQGAKANKAIAKEVKAADDVAEQPGAAADAKDSRGRAPSGAKVRHRFVRGCVFDAERHVYRLPRSQLGRRRVITFNFLQTLVMQRPQASTVKATTLKRYQKT